MVSNTFLVGEENFGPTRVRRVPPIKGRAEVVLIGVTES